MYNKSLLWSMADLGQAIIGDYASSTAHARGLTVMLSERGGLQSFEDEALQKVVGW